MVELKSDSTSLGPLGIIVATWLLSASFILTTDSFSRTLVNNNIKEAKWLLYAVNLAVLVNEIIMLPQVIASSNCSNARESPDCRANAVSFTRCSDYTSVRLFYSVDAIKYAAYIIAKTGVLHLSYQRCTVNQFMSQFEDYHAAKCLGSYCHPECSFIPTSSTIREMVLPFFRVYYIILEVLFYRELLHIVKYTKRGQNYRDLIHQIVLFSIDIFQLIATCIYRLIGFRYNLPTHFYFELYSTAFTIFVMTRFWDKIKGIFDRQFSEKAEP
ncbi:13345_t:CDS:2 [Acaulospora morrowiae]|uniref:13345_t:CDS:1 n=1 Tax=Acaulospora morrowiae TaxID=94023 RepID=A0A9N8VNE9_9GLOM|nr:13345_t:CDS:2 [Acaulospora morrowiae]